MTELLDEPVSSPLTLFYCYARKDKALRDEIDDHLTALHRSKLITSWHDAMIVPGTNWEQEITDCYDIDMCTYSYLTIYYKKQQKNRDHK